MKYIAISLFVIVTFLACNVTKNNNTSTKKQPEVSTEFKLPGWAKNAVIYELNTRQFSPEGNFSGIIKQLDRLQKMGIDIIWLMPIHPISELKRKATGDILVDDIKDEAEKKKYLGSPYAVMDYGKVNPDFGTMADFKSLLAKAHSIGIKIIIDWVPNHTGWDHPWITDHPDWYTKDANGNITDPIDPGTGKSWGWTDVADLNYENKEMRKAMIAEMLFWIKDIGIDGFRCDVAHGIAQDFWDECSAQIFKANPEIFLLAEAEVPSHRNQNTFHASYGWSLHHLLNDIANGNKNASDIDNWYEEDRKKFKKGFHMHFTSNHDENSWNGTVFERMGEGHKAFAILTATFDGMPLLYSGMEEPMRKRLEFFTKDYIGFNNYGYASFYSTLFKLKETNQALWNGAYGGPLVKLNDHKDVYAFSRSKNNDSVHVILNLSKDAQQIKLPKAVAGTDVFSQEKISWTAGHELSLVPWQYYLISNE